MKHQTVITEPGLRLPGAFRFDGSFAADIFGRTGFRRFGEAAEKFYLKPYKDIVTFDWEAFDDRLRGASRARNQRSAQKIAASEKVHAGERDKLDFLRALGIACDGIEAWCGRIAEKYEEAAKTASPERAAELNETAAIVRKTPMNPPETFREALTARLSLLSVPSGQHRAHRQVFSQILPRGYRRGAHNARGSGKSASGTLHHYQHEDAVRKYAQ